MFFCSLGMFFCCLSCLGQRVTQTCTSFMRSAQPSVQGDFHEVSIKRAVPDIISRYYRRIYCSHAATEYHLACMDEKDYWTGLEVFGSYCSHQGKPREGEQGGMDRQGHM
ncbi:hypothetical protein AMECASPLE_036181 [Ameca splendens]|uniref:Uncharacterized protein n=1 Tax=Ameca splendens TaxID=208324 RepID=A0ABV0ZGC4_9TELE